MADFKVPNLCGASPEFNAIQTKFESMITSALDGLEVDASALKACLLYTSPSPRDKRQSRMPSSA